MYNLNDKKFSNNLTDFHFAETDLQLKGDKSNSFLNYQQFVKSDSSKSISDVSEKFKCGKLIGAMTLYQSVASVPRPNEGRIVFSPGATQMHKLKICLKSLDTKSEMQCHETLTNAGDEIQIDNLGILDDTVSVKLSNLKTPKVITNLPDIITNYRLSESQISSVNNENNYNLIINDFHYGQAPSIGSLNYDSIAPIQTQCIHTKLSRCPYKSFELTPFISWDLMQKSVSGKDNYLQNEIVNVIATKYDPITTYMNQVYLVEVNPDISKVSNDMYILDNNIILILSYDEIDHNEETLKALQDTVESNMFSSTDYTLDLLEFQNHTQLYCEFVNTSVESLNSCIFEDANNTPICATRFLPAVKEFNDSFSEVFQTMGIDLTNAITLMDTIKSSYSNFCMDYNYFESINKEITRSDSLVKEQHAIFIAIFAIVSLVVTTIAAVGGAHAYAVAHNRCHQNEKNFPLDQQKTQINSFSKTSSLMPSYYKEFPEYVEIMNGRPNGIFINITNYEDQAADLELSVNNYKLEFKELKTKISEFSIPECTYYHGKAVFTCNVVIVNHGDVNEIPIKSTTPGIMTFKNVILISPGKNQIVIRLTAPNIVTSNVELCIKEDVWKCSTSKKTRVIDTPDIVGNNLIPIGSRLGNYDIDAEYFWYLLNLNLGFSIMMWVLWVVAFICLIILLIVIFRFIRCCFRKTRRTVLSPLRNIFVLMNILIILNVSTVKALPDHFSMIKTYIKSNNFFGFSSSTSTRPFSFYCNYVYRPEEFKLGDRGSYVTNFLFDISCDDFITARYSKRSLSDSQLKLENHVMYKNNIILNVNHITKSYYYTSDDPKLYKIWVPPKLEGSLSEFIKSMNRNFFMGNGGGTNRIITVDRNLNGYWFQEQMEQQTDFYLDKVNANTFIDKYHNIILSQAPEGGFYYYISNITHYYYYFNFWSKGQTDVISFSGERNIKRMPQQLSISSLNKRTVNEKTQPAIMLISAYNWANNGKNILRHIKGNFELDDWVIDQSFVIDKYTKIAELWCNKCNIKLDSNVYRIETGNIKIDNNYCLLPDGKITSVKPGRGPAFKCLCSDKTCYCESETSKTFAKIQIENIKIPTKYEMTDSGIRYRDISLQCFSGEGGYVGIRKDGVFVAQDGAVIVTNDNWKTFSISTENEPIKLTNIEYGTDSVTILGRDTQTYMAKSKGNASDDDSFRNVWNEMNNNFQWVIILTITLPAVLIFLLVAACCYRVYKRKRLTMSGVLKPLYKTANYITDFSGNKSNQLDNEFYKNNNYNKNNLNDDNYNSNFNALKIRRRRNDLY